MAKLQLQSQIKLNQESVSLESLLHELQSLNAEHYVTVFQNANFSLPRQLRMDVLRLLLESHVKQTRKERLALADELNYRLKWFYQYSDFQYVNLLVYYQNENLNKSYVEKLLTSMFEYLVEQKREDIIQSLRDAKKSQNDPFDFQNILLYNNTFNQIFKDKAEEIDGLTLNLIRPLLYKSSTLQELKAFGEKYGIVVPRRLKKEQLLNVIYLELQSRGLLTEDLKAELKKKSVVLIQRYAVDHDIKVSTELKKDEIIEYILEFSHQTKAFYTYPQPDVYALEIDDPFEFEEVAETKQAQANPNPIPIVPVKNQSTKVKPSETKEKDVHTEPTVQPKQKPQDDVVAPNGVPLVLDRQTAKFLKLYSISKNQKLMLLPDKKYHKKRRTFKVQLDQLGNVSSQKKHHGAIGELLILKLLALVVLRTLIFAFAIAFVLGLLVVGYATASYFLNIEALNTINDQINAIEFLGKGLLDHLFDFYRQKGI